MHRKVQYLAIFWLAMAGIAADGAAQVIQNPANPAAPAQAVAEPAQVRPTYVLGPTDQMIIRARDVDEINEKPFRVDVDGTILLPLIGSIQAAGRTVQQLEADITEKLKALVRNPQVSITMTQFRQDIVSFLGAFVKPGLYPLEGRQTLSDMLIKVGNVQPNASRYIKLTRRLEAGPIPLPGAAEDRAGNVSTVEINLGNLSDTINAAEDVVLLANDVITATKAEKIYVEGGFMKIGVLDMDERESLSALQVITMSGGFQPDAEPSKAKILRPVLNTSRRAAIPVDLSKVLATQANDFPLLPNDVLFVPTNKSHFKSVGKVLAVAAPIATGLIFYFISRF
jgi:polysaccharide biosynthesis/export protein